MTNSFDATAFQYQSETASHFGVPMGYAVGTAAVERKTGKILLVESDVDTANTIQTFLRYENHTVDIVTSGPEALARLEVNCWDLVILNMQLPVMTGIDICNEFRQSRGTIPILMLTANDSIDERLAGFDAGVDDYLTKPFDMRELGGRVRALLRRPPEMLPMGCWQIGDFTIDPVARAGTRNGESISLGQKEFQLFEFFMRHPNQVFTGDELINRIWPLNNPVTSEAFRTTMKRLRKKVDPYAAHLKNIHGVGFIFEA